MDELLFRFPSFPRAHEYLGAWCIEEGFFRAMASRWSAANLAAHMTGPPAPLATNTQIVQAGTGKVAVISIAGPMMKQRSSMGGASTIQLRRDVRNAARDPEVSGIVLAIDSPGGTVAGTSDLADEVRSARRRKPVYAHVDDMGASAAYWIASQAEKVFANSRTALVGSIGTLMTVYDLSRAAEKEGVETLVFATGPLKGTGAPGSKVTEDQRKYLQDVVDASQKEFDRAVRSGRGFTAEALQRVRTGGVFPAPAAQENGLIDGIQSLDRTIEEVARVAATGRQNRAAATEGLRPGGFAMNFESWLRSLGFDPAALSTDDRAYLLTQFRAEHPQPTPTPQPAPVGGPAPGPTPAPRPTSGGGDLLAEFRAAMAAESARVANIRRVCRESGDPSMEAEDGRTVTVEEHAVASNWDLMRTELECLRRRRPAGPNVTIPQETQSADVIEAAIAQAGNMPGIERRFSAETLDRAHRQYHGRLGMQQLFLLAARQNGYHGSENVKGNLHEVVRHAMGRGPTAGGFSTFSLPGILVNNVNKFLLAGYENVEQVWRMVASRRNVSDFKTVTSYRLNASLKFEKLAADGEIKHGTLGEESWTNKVDTYAKMLAITRQDLVNDDLGSITAIPRQLGRGGALAFNEVFWTEFLDNATFFTAARGNFDDGADTVLSATSLQAALQLFREQSDANGNPLAATPRLVLTPPALEVTAWTLFNSAMFVPGQGDTSTTAFGTSNPWAGRFTAASSAYLAASFGLTGAVDTNWYLLADPEDVPVIEAAFLNGQETPTVERADTDFDTLGVQFRGYFDFGVSLADYRGGVKMKGAV